MTWTKKELKKITIGRHREEVKGRERHREDEEGERETDTERMTEIERELEIKRGQREKLRNAISIEHAMIVSLQVRSPWRIHGGTEFRSTSESDAAESDLG